MTKTTLPQASASRVVTTSRAGLAAVLRGLGLPSSRLVPPDWSEDSAGRGRGRKKRDTDELNDLALLTSAVELALKPDLDHIQSVGITEALILAFPGSRSLGLLLDDRSQIVFTVPDQKLGSDVGWDLLAGKPIEASELGQAIPLGGAHNGTSLRPGAYAVVGAPRTGKTSGIRSLVAHLGATAMLSFGESPDYDENGRPYQYSTQPALAPDLQLVLDSASVGPAIVAAIQNPGVTAVVVDSLTRFIFAGGGATGSGGIDQTLISGISVLSWLAAYSGKALFLVFNPLAADRDTGSVPAALLAPLSAATSGIFLSSKPGEPLTLRARFPLGATAFSTDLQGPPNAGRATDVSRKLTGAPATLRLTHW